MKNKDKNKDKKGFFEKKKKKTADYKVVLWEDVGHSVREILTFEAERYVDEDMTPFIRNEELKFLELYPQDLHDINPLNEKEIKSKIDKIEKELKRIKSKDLEDYKDDEPNTEDLEFELKLLKAKQRGLKYSEGASYVCFDNKGQVTFNFLRKGNSFFPFKWDTDTSTIHTASEPVVKKAGILLRNKETKYMPKALIETSTLILLGLVVIGVMVNIALGGWLWTKYDNSNLGDMERSQLEINNICSELVITNANLLMTMQDEFKENIEDPDKANIIGLIPK